MEESNDVPQLIHGILEATIFEANHLHHLIHGTIIKVEDFYTKIFDVLSPAHVLFVEMLQPGKFLFLSDDFRLKKA